MNFFLQFLKDKKIASLTRTFIGAVKDIIEEIDTSKNFLCLEYGTGDGALTKYLLSQMNSRSRIIGVDSNPLCVQEVEKIEDPRVEVFLGDVRRIKEIAKNNAFPKADYIISGIPFSFFSLEEREKLILDSHSLLKPGGKFIVYQYSTLMLPVIQKFFKKVRKKLTLKNFPPYFILIAEK